MTWLIVLTTVILSGLTAAPKAPPITIKSVWIALGTADRTPSDREIRAPMGTTVTAYLVVEAKVGRKRVVFTEAPRLRKRGRRIRKLRQWSPKFGQLKVRFYRVEADPKGGIYDNTGTMEPWWHPERSETHPEKWHWCPIDYVRTKTGFGNVWRHRVDATPSRTPNEYGGLGTMRFEAEVTYDGRQYTSRGVSHRDKTGLKRGIATVRMRKDNTDVGYMTELINVPYVYGSSSSGGVRNHQTERAVGADCADMIVYGWRRMGRRIAYTWTQGLKSHTRHKSHIQTLTGGRYLNSHARPLKFGRDVKKGDILLWGRHVAVIAGHDKTGYLTPNTPILHTVVGSPALVPLKKIGFGFDTPPFELRRPRWRR